ncbi:long-chain fatty acid--CoA ligase [Prevotella sp. P5-92]|uniref:AMP-dependent synthetase/ligase n=1 Tax=Prevotella sp. P5-92 TaxID=2024222 RepID=UPI000B975A52|nr:long-chain fatty acid--CoA ligase [Prevotella sp. P5-92]OYP58347.1 long-chain fatty acid--CoA ligase [Prevotella sp. P5-92]
MQTNSHLSVLVHDQAKNYGNREALIYQDFGNEEWKSLSWNDFSTKVKTVSNALLNMGVKVQENIGVFSQNCPQYLFCDYGAWGVRAVTIPFYATSSEQQIQYIVNDAKIRFLFVGEQEQYDKAKRVMSLCPTLERIVVFDASVALNRSDANAIYFDDFLKLGEGFPRQTEVAKLSSEATFEDLANILYTSGTTGDSKGVMLTYGQYHAALAANAKCVNVREEDRVLDFLPFAHIFEKAWAILSVSVGARLIINNDPKRVQQSMRETNPTCMSAVPRFWEKVYAGVMEKIENSSTVSQRIFNYALSVGRKHNIDYLSRGKRPPMSLSIKYNTINKTLFAKIRKELGLVNPNIFPTAGAAISPHIEEFVHSVGINMIAGYGLTESLATVTCDHHGEPYTVGSVGRLVDGLEMKISEEGEVLLKGPTIFKGYYNRKDVTEESFTPDGFFKTGDAGYIKNGELFLTERIKDLFKTSNGKYIAPQMVESRLMVDKYIDQIAIIADERKFVSALIVPEYRLLEAYAQSRGKINLSTEELCADADVNAMLKERIDTLQQQFAYYEQVKRFTILPAPFTMESGELTNTLKLRRRVVNERYKAIIDKMYEE